MKIRDGLIRKGLVLSIILLFVAASVIPSISGSMKENSSVKDLDVGILNDGSQTNEERTSALSDVDWWPMFHHDERHTGYSTSDAPEEKFLLWTYETGWGIDRSPAVADNKLFIGSQDKNLYCLDAQTKEELWTFSIGGNFLVSPSTPAVDNGNVFFSGVNGFIYCRNATTGDEEWTYWAPTPVPCNMGDPTVIDGKVILGTGVCYWGDADVKCLNATSGELLWTFDADLEIYNSPAVVDGKVYIGNDRLYILNASNGNLIRNTTIMEFSSSPTIDNGNVYIGSKDNKLYCFDAETLDEKWTYSTDDWIESTPAVAYGNVYFGSNDNNVYCLDTNGLYKWKTPTGSDVRSSPAVADEKVYIGSDDKHIYCLDYDTGEVIWSDETGGAVVSSPAIANGLVYVGSGDANVYAYRGGSFTVELTRPKKGQIYFRDKLLWNYPILRLLRLQPLFTIVFGSITLQAKAEDSRYNISYVKFTNYNLPFTECPQITEKPYEWEWKKFTPGLFQLGTMAKNELGQEVYTDVEASVRGWRFG